MPKYLFIFAACALLVACADKATEPKVPTTALRAVDDSYDLERKLQVTALNGVLANDRVPKPFTISVSSQPEHGTLLLDEDGAFSYERTDFPSDNSNTGDSFSYTLTAGNKRASANVTLSFTTTAPPDTEPEPQPQPEPEALCAASPKLIQTGQAFECQLEPGDSLTPQPQGLVIHERSGLLRWTPTRAQMGDYDFIVNGDKAKTFDLSVTAGKPDPAGLYVAPDGDDGAAGSADAPFASLQHAVDSVKPGQTIYMRGGDYFHPEYGEAFDGSRSINQVAKIQVNGERDKPITLRNYGNEFARIVSDEGGILIDKANYWIIEGLELQGSTQSLDYGKAMADWWADDNSRSSGNGIRYREAQHITVRGNVVHDFPGGGIANNRSDCVKVENNIVYNNGWWSSAGTHGIANSKLKTVSGCDDGESELIMRGNLVFANRSIIISHVFSKAKVALAIDEGNGMHAQNNTKDDDGKPLFSGRALIENNLLLYNGKAGFGINTMDNITVRNNSFYQNAKEVSSAAEITIQPGDLSLENNKVEHNIFGVRAERKTILELGKAKTFNGVGDNVTSSRANDQNELPASVVEKPQVFRNPAKLDFRPAAGVPANMGVPETELTRMFAQAKAYGVSVEEPATVVTEQYLKDMRQLIFDTWPAEYASVDTGKKDADGKPIFRALELEDKGVRDADGNSPHYSYAQRCHYPDPPTDPMARPCD